MDKKPTYERLAWIDRFNVPTTKQLRSALTAEATKLFDAARHCLLELDGVGEVEAWYGDCWHWTLEYRVDGSDDPLSLIVPSPTDLQLAIPVDREFTDTLPMRRMTRSIRDGLQLAQEPFDTRWAVWSVTSTNQLSDLQDLVERKLQHLQKRAG